MSDSASVESMAVYWATRSAERRVSPMAAEMVVALELLMVDYWADEMAVRLVTSSVECLVDLMAALLVEWMAGKKDDVTAAS